jgi:hypothetical protein
LLEGLPVLLRRVVLSRSAVVAALLLLVAVGLPAATAPPLKVLFLGNSLTSRHDMPAMVRAVAQAGWDETLETTVVTADGASLRDHIESGRLDRTLSAGRFDVVVLQELGGFPLCDPSLARCADAPAAMAEAVRRARAGGARVICYSTWQPNPTAQTALSDLVRARGRELGIDVVDTGAMLAAWASSGGATPLEPDGHPTTTGSWLIAAALAEAVLRTPPSRLGSVSTCTSTNGNDCSTLSADQLSVVMRAARQAARPDGAVFDVPMRPGPSPTGESR